MTPTLQYRLWVVANIVAWTAFGWSLARLAEPAKIQIAPLIEGARATGSLVPAKTAQEAI